MKFFVSCIGIISLSLAACADVQTATEPAPTVQTVSETGAYMIVRGTNYNPQDLGPYAASLPPIYAKYGGRYVSFATNFVTLEGQDKSQAIIMSAWPSVEAAENFWASPEYREAIKLRDGIGEFTVVVLPALPSN